MPRHWLFKTEPGCFSIDHLAALPGSTTSWDGVRNYQARNFMRDMRAGDLGLFYHSVTNPSVAGVVEIVREAYPDHTAWDPEDRHYDPASTPEKPRWFMVDVRLVRAFARPVPLALLRTLPELAGMELLRKGSRLSVQPVSPQEYETVLRLADTPAR
ncbi:EVE domain-containing protein [Nitratidesulfovibrio sp. 1201_IL3209]|uniref:EVE domain-containing protein n=1 Tax=Nitratidesulfovibrio sp. 1201_IL3209 TaxID=3084053 RepID=UPI002FD9E2DE